MFDLHHGSRQTRSRIRQFFHPQCTIRFVPEGNLSNLAVLHLDILYCGITEQMITRGYTLIDCIIAAECQRDGNSTVRPCAECADGRAFRIDHLKDRAAQRRIRTFLQLDDFQTGIRHRRIPMIRIITVCGQLHGNRGVGIAHIVLELTIFAGLCTGGIKDRVFVDVSRKG